MIHRLRRKFEWAQAHLREALNWLENLTEADKTHIPGYEQLEIQQMGETVIKYCQWLDLQLQSHWMQEPDTEPDKDIHTDQEAP